MLLARAGTQSGALFESKEVVVGRLGLDTGDEERKQWMSLIVLTSQHNSLKIVVE